MKLDILVLPGDGIGPEITREAVKVLRALCDAWGHDLHLEEGLVGGASLKAHGVPVSGATLEAARKADAVLLGAVGLPEFDREPPSRRPERGLLDLRQAMGVFANLRPVKAHPALYGASPLKESRIAGTDLLIVRELTGGLYFGQPRSLEGEGRARRAVNTMTYSYGEIERVARMAFQLAAGRRSRVTSVDKANVLETSQLWRAVVTEVALDFPAVALDHLYVDNAAMQLVLDPTRFDVLLTENLFGDILSDEAAVLTGSLGMLPSASLGGKVGLYEPVHGSAPDIAGRGLANPLGAILSAAMLLRHSLGLETEAKALENAVSATLTAGYGTPDLKCERNQVSTRGLGELMRLNVANTLLGIPS